MSIQSEKESANTLVAEEQRYIHLNIKQTFCIWQTADHPHQATKHIVVQDTFSSTAARLSCFSFNVAITASNSTCAAASLRRENSCRIKSGVNIFE